MKSLIRSDLKVECLGQCIIKAAMPRYCLPSIPFALGVEVDHMFGSRWLNSQLFSLGLAISYAEINRFKQGVFMSENTTDILKSQATEGSFTTFIADNVDHNIATLDGRGSFHGMGIIAVTTNKEHHKIRQANLKRPKSVVKVDDLIKKKGIPILAYDFPSKKNTEVLGP